MVSSHRKSFFSETEAQKIRSESEKAERSGKWAEGMLNIAKNKRLFHLLVPRKYGGKQLSLPSLLPILEEASELDGSFGWTLTLGAGAGIFAAFMEPNLAEHLFADPSTFIAGSGFPGGVAELHDNGKLTINGYWKYASGAPRATVFTANCILSRNRKNVEIDGKPVIKSVIMLPEEVIIHPTWNSYGLKATASHDFEASGLVIPPERCFTIAAESSHIDDPLYRYPFVPFAESTLAASLMGIGRNFMQRAAILITDKIKETQQSALREYVNKILKDFMEVRDEFYATIDESWQSFAANRPDSSARISQVSKLSRKVVAKTLDAAHHLYPHTGMRVLNPQTEINRAWRDLHTASQHTMLTPEI